MPSRSPRRPPDLEIVLVNARHAKAPENAELLAQANLDAGGISDQPDRATTPLPPQQSNRDGDALVDADLPRTTPQARERPTVMTRAESTVAAPNKPPQPETPLEQQGPGGNDMLTSAAAQARLQAEIDRQVRDYAKRPRRTAVGSRTREHHFAQYLDSWRLKIERIGTLNYPEDARGKIYGSLVLTVSIRADGSVEKIEINRSSGHTVLDEAAVRIVRMGEPYAPFPENIRRNTDVIDVTRIWTFTNQSQLVTYNREP
ncbi:MAG: TonB family protein [Azoarcus sp.]|nr:TonB family protein [Azoarcus sp.]